MRPVVTLTDGVPWSVCRSVCHDRVSCKKQLIEMLFGLWTRVGPRNRVLDGGPEFPTKRGIFEGKGRPIVS